MTNSFLTFTPSYYDKQPHFTGGGANFLLGGQPPQAPSYLRPWIPLSIRIINKKNNLIRPNQINSFQFKSKQLNAQIYFLMSSNIIIVVRTCDVACHLLVCMSWGPLPGGRGRPPPRFWGKYGFF